MIETTMKRSLTTLVVVLAAVLVTACGGGGGGTREQIRIVGSSTVFPFAKRVSELLAQSNADIPSPLVESTGSGAGFQLFCQGLGADTPDIVNASRRIKPAELETCLQNGVTEITEIQVGMDGLAIASAQGGITMDLSPALLYRAIAERPFGEEQTAERWSDLDPSLPDDPILIYGPPSTSGTRDSLEELVMIPWMRDRSGDGRAEGAGRGRLRRDLHRRKERRHLCRSGRTGQSDRAEDREQPARDRRVRLLLPRGERGRGAGFADERRRADLRKHFELRLSGRAGALHLRKEGACRRDQGARALSRDLGAKLGSRRRARADRAGRLARRGEGAKRRSGAGRCRS